MATMLASGTVVFFCDDSTITLYPLEITGASTCHCSSFWTILPLRSIAAVSAVSVFTHWASLFPLIRIVIDGVGARSEDRFVDCLINSHHILHAYSLTEPFSLLS